MVDYTKFGYQEVNNGFQEWSNQSIPYRLLGLVIEECE